MAVSVRGTTSLGFASRTGTTFTRPAGTQQGDLLLIIMFGSQFDASPPTLSAPAGFTALAANPYSETYDGFFSGGLYGFYKVAGSSEPTSYTVGGSATTEGIIYALAGGTDVLRVSTERVVFSTSGSSGSVTTTTNGAFLIHAVHCWDSAVGTPPGGYAERYEGTIFYAANRSQATAGATGTAVSTHPGNTSTGRIGTLKIGVEAAAVGSLAVTDAADTISDGNNIVFDETGAAIVDEFGVALRTEASPLGRVFLVGLALTDDPDTLSSSGVVFWAPVTGSLSVVDLPDTLTALFAEGWRPKRASAAVWSDTLDPDGDWTELNPSSGGWSRAS